MRISDWSSDVCSSDLIDGISVCSFVLPPDNAVTLSEQFGIPVGWAYYGTAGGAGPVAAVLNAVRAIDAGHATTILCLAGAKYDRTEERRVGAECVSPCIFRRST